MISYNSNNQVENSKYNTSLVNFETSKLNFSKSRFNYNMVNPRRKNFSVKKREVKSKLLKKRTNTLFQIFEEEKEKNINNNNINKYKPKLSLKELHKIISSRFHNEYKKHYINMKSITSNPGTERPTIYGYYQINNLIENKKCEIKLYYNEFLLDIYNEYLLIFMNISQSHIMLRFLITFLHRNNIYNNYMSINERFQYKTNDFINCINTMINFNEMILMQNYNFNEIILMQNYKNYNLLGIINNAKKISSDTNIKKIETDNFNAIGEFLKENNIFEFNNLTDLSINLNGYDKYLPILLDVPLIYHKSIFPNYSVFGYEINLLLKHYINKRLREVKINIIKKEIISDNDQITEKKNPQNKNKYDKINYVRFFNDSLLKSQKKSSFKKESKDETINNNNKSFLDANKKNKENIPSSDSNQIFDIKNLIKDLYKAQKNKNNFTVTKDKGSKIMISKKNIIEKNKESKNKLVKKNTSLKIINFTRNNNNKIVLQKGKNKKENNSTNKNSNSIYKKNSIEEKNKTMISQRSNYYNSTQKNYSSKLITQYNNNNIKYIHKYKNKNIFNSLSETKNSSKDLSKYIKGKNIYTNTLISTLGSSENTNNNFLQKNKSQRLKIYKFKDTKKFLMQGLKKNKKYILGKILLRNVSNFNMDLYMKYYCQEAKKKLKYNPIKTYDINVEKSAWEKGIYSQNATKMNYNYDTLMYKIKNFRNKKLRSQKLLDRNINALNVSKLNGIYDDL